MLAGEKSSRDAQISTYLLRISLKTEKYEECFLIHQLLAQHQTKVCVIVFKAILVF